MMDKTIVIVNDYAHINGGAGQVALSSAIGLAKDGNRVILFSSVEPITPSLYEAGVEIVVTGQHDILSAARHNAVLQGIWNFKAQKKMQELLISLNPASTIVHVHSWTKANSSSIIRTAILYGFKVVCTLHDYFIACPNGGFFDFQKREICGETPLSLGCLTRNCDTRSYSHKLWRATRQVVQKKIGRVPSGIKYYIILSDFSGSILEPFLPRGAQIFRINNPINVDFNQCHDLDKNDTFTFVGRLSPEKGADMFACAANALSISPVFVGEGILRQTIERICPKAHISGWVNEHKVMEYLSLTRALVLPSLLYEVSPLVIAEAAAMGVPSIVPTTCAARDMVDDGITGLWFRGGDYNDLVEKMRKMLDPDFANKLGKAAFEKYRNCANTMSKHIAQLHNCYDYILSEAPPPL